MADEQGGALAELRAKIDDHVRAQNGLWCGKGSGGAANDAQVALDAELAAVKARIDAFKRFVRAYDAQFLIRLPANFTTEQWEEACREVAVELQAARVDITDEYLAP